MIAKLLRLLTIPFINRWKLGRRIEKNYKKPLIKQLTESKSKRIYFRYKKTEKQFLFINHAFFMPILPNISEPNSNGTWAWLKEERYRLIMNSEKCIHCLLDKRSILSIHNKFLLYKQNPCPIWYSCLWMCQ